MNFYSDVLSRPMQAEVILPETPPPEHGHPTLFLLHGMTDDHTAWQRRTSIERYADAHQIAVVMPGGHLGWYTNTHAGERYLDYVSDELVCLMRRMLPCLSHRRMDTWIAGLSMGGYGALRCALARPELFSRAASFSGAMDVSALPSLPEPLAPAAYWRDIFGVQIEGSEHDLFRSAALLRENRPEIRMWCGTEDFLYDMNLRMRDHLRALGYALDYHESEGDHQWKYWDREIQSALDWFVSGREKDSWR